MEIENEDGRRTCKITADTTFAMQVASALKTTPDRIVITGTLARTGEAANAIFEANRAGIEVLLKPAA